MVRISFGIKKFIKLNREAYYMKVGVVMNSKIKTALLFMGSFIALMCFTDLACAAGESKSFGDVATRLTTGFTAIAKLITAGAYLAGLGFSVGAIMKFKNHKDNPSQVPIGTPIAMTFIAAALLFLPSILGVTGGSLFEGGGTTGGPSGMVFEGKKSS
jgi:intracellular multiplication protein IcmD